MPVVSFLEKVKHNSLSLFTVKRITKTAKENYYCTQTKSKHSKFELLKKGSVQLRFILM